MDFSAINFWQKLVQWDQYLFEKINGDWANPFFDAVMPFLRNSLSWVPLYMFLLVLKYHTLSLHNLHPKNQKLIQLIQ